MIDEKEVFASLPALRESTVEMMLDTFPVVLWYKSQRDGKEYWCSRCGAHDVVKKLQRTVTNDEMKLLWSRHKDKTRCPACGREGQMACIGTVKVPDRYRKYHWFLIVQPVSENEVWIRETKAWYAPGGWDAAGKKREIWPHTKVEYRDYVRYRLTPGMARQWTNFSYYDWSESKEIRDETTPPIRGTRKVSDRERPRV